MQSNDEHTVLRCVAAILGVCDLRDQIACLPTFPAAAARDWDSALERLTRGGLVTNGGQNAEDADGFLLVARLTNFGRLVLNGTPTITGRARKAMPFGHRLRESLDLED